MQKLILTAQKIDVFYINNNTTIADLFLLAEKPDYAETEILKYLKKNEATAYIFSRFADVQWILGKFVESKRNYTKALMINPNEIQFQEIKNKDLLEVIKKHSAEMAPAWGYIYGLLPMIEFNEINKYCDITKRGLHAYYLLLMAEKLTKQKDFKQTIDFRKLLKEKEPELFAAYFELLKKRKNKA